MLYYAYCDQLAKQILKNGGAMIRGRVYLYYEDRAPSSNPAPIFIPETSMLFDDEKFCHLPIVTDEQFDMIVREESRIKRKGAYSAN